MTWNHRVVRFSDDWGTYYGVYEVYYDDSGEITARTEEVSPYGDTLEELKEDCRLFLEACSKPVLTLEDFPK